MKICIVVSRDKKNQVALSYLTFFASKAHEVSLILIDEGVNLAKKDFSEPLGDELKDAIRAQTGLELSSIKDHKDLLRFIKNRFNVSLKACDTSLISLKISKKLGEKNNLEEMFDLATMHEVVSLIYEADLTMYF